MKTILTVIQKELLNTLRDRRTLLSSVVLPAVAIPLLLFVVVKVQSVMIEKDATKTANRGSSRRSRSLSAASNAGQSAGH